MFSAQYGWFTRNEIQKVTIFVIKESRIPKLPFGGHKTGVKIRNFHSFSAKQPQKVLKT